MNDLMKLLGVLGIVAVFISIIMALLAMIGAVNFGKGCFLRYDNGSGGGNSDRITNTVMLDATGNYTVNMEMQDGNLVSTYDPNRYGEWVNVNLSVKSEQVVDLKIEGTISLCRAYIPKNNIQQASDLDNLGNKIPIPRIEETELKPVNLIFDAKTDEWRNIAELYNNDQVIISIFPDQKKLPGVSSNIASVDNSFEVINDGGKLRHVVKTADCSAGKTQYSPLCGRYSISSGQYVDSCKWNNDYWNCNYHSYCPKHPECFWSCPCGAAELCCEQFQCDRCGAYTNIYKTAPEPYTDDDKYTFSWSDDLNKLYFTGTALSCSNSNAIPSGKCPDSGDFNTKDQPTIDSPSYQNSKRFWYSANNAAGLLYRMGNSETPASAKTLGSTYSFAKILENQSAYDGINSGDESANNQKYKIIYNDIVINAPKTYLQYRLWSKDDKYTNNTGGYVLNIKQTKCRRNNGNSFDDVVASRGRVQYLIVPFDGDNPNTAGITYPIKNIDVTDEEGTAKITADRDGHLWMKIYNKQEDYKDSYGRYQVKFMTSEKVGSFTLLIITPLFETLKTKIQDAAESIFSNMTCYGGQASSCSSFFNYIRGMLILYVMSLGAMYLLGMAKLTQQDLVIRLVKIAIVAGLMNGSTFEFFNTYLFDLITGFSDAIISNMSGYSMFTSTDKIANPFMFLDALMSKLLFSKTFMAQFLALLSMGLSGMIYFVIVFIAIVIVIITVLRAIVVYLMAFMAVALLIGIAPLFLTFMLFDFTRYLFDNWMRFTFRYMIEPVVLMAGIIIITQLFTIYLDYATGYSVCWKCALPIKIPFPSIPGLPSDFSGIELFCINWFAPWGMDFRSGMMGINLQHYIALIILAYGMYGYVDFSSKMVVRLTNNTAGPSATQAAAPMSRDMEQGTLKKVGLDDESRSKIEAGAKGRLEKRNEMLDNANKVRAKGNSTNNSGNESKSTGGGTKND